MRIVLASASPRRKELLAWLKTDFEIMVSDVEEVVTESDPAKVVEELSGQKAQAVFEQFHFIRSCNYSVPEQLQFANP